MTVRKPMGPTFVDDFYLMGLTLIVVIILLFSCNRAPPKSWFQNRDDQLEVQQDFAPPIKSVTPTPRTFSALSWWAWKRLQHATIDSVMAFDTAEHVNFPWPEVELDEEECDRDPGLILHDCVRPSHCGKFIDVAGDGDCDWGDLRDFAAIQDEFGCGLKIELPPELGWKIECDPRGCDYDHLPGCGLGDWMLLAISWGR